MIITFYIILFIFRGTSGIDIDLRRVDIDQCPLPPGSNHFNIFASSDKCKKQTTYVSYYILLL